MFPQLAADLLALIRFEEIQDAVDGLSGVGRVQRRQNKMPGIGGAHGGGKALASRISPIMMMSGSWRKHVLERVME